MDLSFEIANYHLNDKEMKEIITDAFSISSETMNRKQKQKIERHILHKSNGKSPIIYNESLKIRDRLKEKLKKIESLKSNKTLENE